MTRSTAAKFNPVGFEPTQEQRTIQLSQHRVTLIEANAGAAKTTTLALRIGEAIARGTAPEKILALVFTPEARDVMKARLVSIGIAHGIAARIHVRTVEEFASDVLRRLDDGVIVQSVSPQDFKSYALEALERVSERYADKVEFLDVRTHNLAISELLAYQLQLKATMALARDVDDLPLSEAADLLGVPLTDYLATLEYEEIRLGTFDEVEFRGELDATYDLARALMHEREVRDVLPHYTLVVGDELHDLNEASYLVLEALLDQDGLYFVGAGDKDQVIYARLGADDAYLQHRFKDSYPDSVRFPLTMTYRHGPHLAYAIEAFKSKPVDSTLPLATLINEQHYEPADPNSCGDRVVEAIKKWRADKLPLEGCAVLMRERHQSIAIENALMRADIGYRTVGMQGYLQREEILFLRGMIAIALKNLSAVTSDTVRRAIVESLALFAEIDLDPQALEQAKTDVATDPATLSWFFSGQIQRVGSEKARARISAAVIYITELDPQTPAHLGLRALCDQMDFEAIAKRLYVHPHDALVVTKSVEGFISAAAHTNMNLREFSEWLGAAEAFVATRRTKNLVLLECVANAKGKEFDHVILPFLAHDEFPSALKDVKEEENLFYVAATRAKSRLTLLSPQDESQRSPFVKRMRLAATRIRANVAVSKNQALVPAAVTRQDLVVAYADKDVVKALGALWDATRRVWYVRPGANVKPFEPWIRKD